MSAMTQSATLPEAPDTPLRQAQDKACRHHWLLGQPADGSIAAVCRECGSTRHYPAVLDDLDPGIEIEPKGPVGLPDGQAGVATAAGGARPSSGAPREAQDIALLGDSES